MVDGKPIMDQVHIFENLCTDITNEGMKLDEIFLANILLEKFPPSWSEYRNHLKHKKRDMPLEELIGHMRTEEENRLKDKAEKMIPNSSTNTNLVETGRPSNVNRFKVQGHKAFQFISRPQKEAILKTPQVHLVESNDVIIAVVVEANLVANFNDWVLDTGASRHLWANKEMFQDFEEVADGDCVYMGNSATAGIT
ncbi:hypothetical protein LIER_33077 [Lithospermum erythrorhizon]|uniref:Retrovirus-related Pol polyprotein from transposon TNT 1-94-like beta-barrel domain-containing protein n=1 Tax=Lithospermum erythrorhizon TaxID=34254 RepID=A0AAV3RXX5_LITER